MGQLLGMDVDDTLEITNCYPFMSQPTSTSNAGPDGIDVTSFEREQQQYQRDMMWCVREVNIDHQVVGWYQSTGSQMGSFLSSQWIDTQYNYQKHLGNIVCLIYDPVRTEEGLLSIHAYRLTKNFMNLMKKGDYNSLGFSNSEVLANTIIEEVPISLHNSSLINASLVELDQAEEFSGENDVELARLSIGDKPVLEQSMEFLICELDTLGKEQSKYSYFMRNLVRSQGQLLEKMRKRRAENKRRESNGEEPLPDEDDVIQMLEKEPARLECKVLLKDLDSYVESIKSLASEGIVKQYGVSAVQAGDE
ncbi:Translation initiation factor eIF3 subunit H [Gracilaria domingensis]|nr:Translation initiation factor eIF3 subunit H [Gracilaria domingensis]